MHYYAIVAYPPTDTDPETIVAQLMAPWREGDGGEGWWDWYQIGGRWTGKLSNSYDPRTDPNNVGSDGELAWPTNWTRFQGDVARLGDVRCKLAEQLPYHLVAGESYTAKELWDDDLGNFVPGGDVAAAIASLSDNCTVVVVDCHC